MNDSSHALSDEALSQLIFESQVTMPSTEFSSNDVFDRIQKFNQLYANLATKPEGVALLYQERGRESVNCQQFSEKVVVGRLPKSARNPDGCDLAIQDDELSRVHFEVILADDFYILRDLDSRNGTYINKNAKRIHECVLKAGDFIFAGRVMCVFTGR